MLKRKLTKIRLCKKYGDDIWGDLSKYTKIEKLHLRSKFNEYIKKSKRRRLDNGSALRIDVIDPRVQVKRKTSFGKIFIMKQKLRYFYGILKDYQFKNLYLKAVYKYIKNSSISKLIGYYESRLDVTLYRSNFLLSPMQCRQWINHGNIYVNGKKITVPSFRLFPSDFISFKISKGLVRNNIIKKLKINNLQRYIAEHLEVCYRQQRILFLNAPASKKVFFPFKFDYYKLFNVYNYR